MRLNLLVCAVAVVAIGCAGCDHGAAGTHDAAETGGQSQGGSVGNSGSGTGGGSGIGTGGAAASGGVVDNGGAPGSGVATTGGTSTSSWWTPAAGTTWQWQMSGRAVLVAGFGIGRVSQLHQDRLARSRSTT
jgi:hypothetical protein